MKSVEHIFEEEIVEHNNSMDHSLSMAKVSASVGHYILQNKLGYFAIEPDTYLPNYPNKIIPDMVFVSHENAGILDEVIMGMPDLIIEITSPSTFLSDTKKKIKLYAEAGVKEYRILTAETGVLSVYVLNAENEFELFSFANERVAGSSFLLPGYELAIENLVEYRN